MCESLGVGRLDTERITVSEWSSLKNILLVEDDILIRMMVAEDLREQGYNVVEAADGDEAVQLLHAGITIDVVFSDVAMPGSIDGFALLNIVLESFDHIPFVMTSGHVSPDNPVLERTSGFLPKPYSMLQLRGVLEQCLASPI